MKNIQQVSKKDIDITAKLQKICADSYFQVSSLLNSGMSEKDIAYLVKKELSKKE